MNFKIEYSDMANYDLYWIVIYLSRYPGGHEIAKKKIGKIRKTIRMLETFPMLYQVGRNEFCMKHGIRVIPVENYLVHYVIDEKQATVKIVRIISEKQNAIDALTKLIV